MKQIKTIPNYKNNICKDCNMNQANKCLNRISPNYKTPIREISFCNDLIPIYGDRT